MPRRRLRLSCPSDEDEEDNNRQQQNDSTHQHPTLTQPHVSLPPPPDFNTNPTSVPPEPIAISDEDEELINISDNLTPPSPHPPAHGVTTDSPLGDFLCRMGLRLRREWLEACLQGLQTSLPAFSNLDVPAKAKLCFEQFLFSDMNYSGVGVLPHNVASMHLVDLPGPFVLQVDEIVNISCPLRDRYQDAPPGLKRCLKLSMTDGVQRVFGMEYRPIKDLKALAPAGLKVLICNVHIRRGLLMLVPEVLEVLGGVVKELDEAQQRLIVEVNKPPRGKRSRTGVAPSLATRATRAAWPLNTGNINGNGNTYSFGNATPIQADGEGNASYASGTDGGQRTMEESPLLNSADNAVPHASSIGISHIDEMHIDAFSMSRERAVSSLHLNAATDLHIHTVAPRTDNSERIMEESSIFIERENEVLRPSSVASNVEEMHIDTFHVSQVTATSNQPPNVTPVVDDIYMVDELEHPLILSGNREIPFTYLASLSAKLAAMKDKAHYVQGKIKCFLTGVKKFQYKQRSTFELQCYIDDGSLISEIVIDHTVVQKGIGHSPEQVSAALSSSDIKIVSGMKETLRQFQIFLVNFEGIMLVQIGKTSLPVALEMCQGCPASDAWLLLRRLKSSASQTPKSWPSDPIDISP